MDSGVSFFVLAFDLLLVNLFSVDLVKNFDLGTA